VRITPPIRNLLVAHEKPRIVQSAIEEHGGRTLRG